MRQGLLDQEPETGGGARNAVKRLLVRQAAELASTHRTATTAAVSTFAVFLLVLVGFLAFFPSRANAQDVPGCIAFNYGMPGDQSSRGASGSSADCRSYCAMQNKPYFGFFENRIGEEYITCWCVDQRNFYNPGVSSTAPRCGPCKFLGDSFCGLQMPGTTDLSMWLDFVGERVPPPQIAGPSSNPPAPMPSQPSQANPDPRTSNAGNTSVPNGNNNNPSPSSVPSNNNPSNPASGVPALTASPGTPLTSDVSNSDAQLTSVTSPTDPLNGSLRPSTAAGGALVAASSVANASLVAKTGTANPFIGGAATDASSPSSPSGGTAVILGNPNGGVGTPNPAAPATNLNTNTSSPSNPGLVVVMALFAVAVALAVCAVLVCWIVARRRGERFDAYLPWKNASRTGECGMEMEEACGGGGAAGGAAVGAGGVAAAGVRGEREKKERKGGARLVALLGSKMLGRRQSA
ncbi:hypothetical protein HDU96_002795, partial [Phlyctochytrium bullatum]